MHLDLDTPNNALAIGAHPDDIDFGAGGTLAKWASKGCKINYLICTDGSKGSWNQDEDTSALIKIRQSEQKAAFRKIAQNNQGEIVFLNWIDGELESNLDQRSQVSFWIRKIKPDIVLGHDPWKRYRLHPDHRHAGLLAVEAIVGARDPHFFPEHKLKAFRPKYLALWEADEIDYVENIEDFLDQKIGALLEHKSQLLSTMNISDSSSSKQLSDFDQWVKTTAAQQGSVANVGFGEAFKLITQL